MLPAFARRRTPRAGFTLLEVLVSIALVLLIILGVNQVFALTSQAVGAGNALSEQVRNSRSAQSIITNDLSNAEVKRAPFIVIESEVLLGFRNRADQLADIDYDPTGARAAVEAALLSVDRDRDGKEDADPTPRAILTSRTHRADILKFFTRQSGRRQTGNAQTFTSGVASSEQFIVYGHLRQPALPDDLKTGRLPGIGPSGTVLQPTGSNAAGTDNPNNFYATQWILGRNAFLLRDPELVSTQRIIREAGGGVTSVPRATYYGRDSSQYGPTSNSGAPFTEGSQATSDGATMDPNELVEYSLYDLMGIPMERYRTDFLPKFIASSSTPPWHDAFVYRQTGFPSPSRPISSQGVARTVPCFVPACTQFVVEYAGDFVTQDPTTGDVTVVANGIGGGTDGIVDFNVVTAGGVTRRTTRWYGFPRDVNADGKIFRNIDVVPLRDFLSGPMPFERVVLPRSADPALGYGGPDGVGTDAHYRCVWGPDTTNFPTPKLIRIVMATDDPAGRLGAEQFSEFVVELP